jgi:penicillin-binding protein 2
VNPDSPRLRLSILGVVAFALFAALFARLWYLQVMANDEFQVAAEANAVRTVLVEAPRGRILDTAERVLVDNRISIQVTIDRSALAALGDEERQRVLATLADALSRAQIPTTVEQLEERIEDQRFSPFVPVPVAGDVPESLKIWIDEHPEDLPAVAAERVAVRDYPYGHLAAHVIGYTGKISKQELDAVPDELQEAKEYSLNDSIGKYGVERVYEAELRGTPGVKRIEVDAEGNPVRVIEETPPVPGNDVVLNLNIDVQAVAEQALQAGLERAGRRAAVGQDAPNRGSRGSTVVVDPSNGGVLAMASYPTFAPSDFIDGISQSEWVFLGDEVNGYPLNNWALQGQYAPGSTFKPFTAVAALQAGLVTPESTVEDDGQYEVPGCRGDSCTFRNDGRKAWGRVNLSRSLTVSSDFYYYDLGARSWIQQDSIGGPEGFADRLKAWGFHDDTGIDLPGEQEGRIPSPAWLDEYCASVGCSEDAATWRTGKSVNMAIGQGELLATPLQVANAYATIGNGGTIWVPKVVKEIRDGATGEARTTARVARPVGEDESELVDLSLLPEQRATVDLRPEWRAALVDGLVGVTTREGGTAVGAFSGFPSETFPVAAKTGTAQVSGKAPTAGFAAFGPAENPRYAVSVFMEESGYGGSAAAPVARRLFDVLSSTVPLPDAAQGLQVVDPEDLAPEAGNVRD